MLALCAFSLYADTGGSSAVGSVVRGVGLGSDHRRSVAPHGSPPGHRAPVPTFCPIPVLVLRAVLVTFTITITIFLFPRADAYEPRTRGACGTGYRVRCSLDRSLLKRSSRAATHTPPSYRSGPEACKGGAAPFGNPRQGAGPRPPDIQDNSHFSAQRAHWSR